MKPSLQRGFTIVELLVVVVVIAILASILVVSYNGITSQAKEVALKTDLSNAAKQIQLVQVQTGVFPANTNDIKKADKTTLSYVYDNATSTFCLAAQSDDLPGKSFYMMDGGSIQSGECPVDVVDGVAIQVITAANCSTTRTRAVDARDGRTYWVQKLADGNCWMLTNLAYAGGGTNTYGDIMPTGDGTAGTLNGPDNTGTESRLLAKYYIPVGANPTSGTTNPSTSSDGGVTSPQYGYLYNWCAAMGGQTQACINAAGVSFTNQSICPANWRLPTGGPGGEFEVLNTVINSGSTSSDQGLRDVWLAQYSGAYLGGSLVAQGDMGGSWSSTENPSLFGYMLRFVKGSQVVPSNGNGKEFGFSVRCVAQ